MRILKTLKFLTSLVFLLTVIAGLYIAFNSKDIPPPDVSDLHVPYPDVPDEENAFTVLKEETTKIELTSEDSDILRSVIDDKPIAPETVEEILKRFEEPLDRIAEGVKRKRCIFPRPSSVSTMVPEVTGILESGRLWSVETHLALQQGNPRRAITATRRNLILGRSVVSEPETLIQYIVGNAVLFFAVDGVERLVLDPTVNFEALLELQELLSMQQLLDKALTRALKSEFLFGMIAIQEVQTKPEDFGADTSYFEHPWTRFFPSFFLKPNETKVMFAEYYRRSLPNIGKFYSKMDTRIEEELVPSRGRIKIFPPAPNMGGLMISRIMLPAVDGVFHQYSEMLGNAVGLQTLIALRSFEEEQGELPRGLDLLVPDFLEKVPVDPFDGNPLRYDPERRIVWSVGEDLIDQNGSTVQREDTRSDERRNQEDMVWEMAW